MESFAGKLKTLVPVLGAELKIDIASFPSGMVVE